MKRFIKLSLATSIILGTTLLMAEDSAEERERVKSVKAAIGTFAPTEEKDITVVDKFKKMFLDGKVTGKVKSVYAGYNQKSQDIGNTYATALGGMLKYELAEYNGFNAGVAFTTSNDMRFITGSRDEYDSLGNPIQRKQNDELSSSDGSYTQLAEAYINYNYENLNLRVGRQVLETPLADSDDVRMIPNSFEAYVATYNLNGIEIMAGNVQRWQGVDAGLDDGWVKTGEDGTWFGGVSYSENLEFNAWYYNITKFTNAAYVDIGYNYDINKDIQLHGALQYLHESELSDSGVKADIYGALVELVAYGFGFNIAVDKAKRHDAKESFSGTGGGSMFTSMDTMIIDEIAIDREAIAIVGGVVYEYDNFAFLYAYGDFNGKANSAGEKAHIVEQNIGLEYMLNEEFSVAAIYVMEEDKQSVEKTENDWNRLQVMVAYNF
ncbi:MAG: OprD family outer membrane porin [Campylobacterota bacterium]|nr:OprD family outer membrane porin [Campylobacterota bacterium]